MGANEIPSKPSAFPIRTIEQLVEEKARANGDADFLIEAATGDRLTYREASERADVVAASLRGRGVEKGDTVVTLLPNCIDHMLVWFGCAKAGAVWVPVNTELKRDDLIHTIESTDPEIVVADARFLDRYRAVRDELSGPRNEVVRGTTADGMDPFDDLLEGTGSLPDVTIDPGDPAVIVFTGGTTGDPKPVLHSQFAPLTGAYRYVSAYDPTPDDRHLTVLRPFHIGGQHFGVLGPMMADIDTVLAERFSASRFFDQVNEFDATLLDLTGSMWRMLLNTHPEPVENTGRISLAIAEPSDYGPIRERFDVDLMEAYALTEGGGVLLTSYIVPPGAVDADGEGKPVGRPGGWAEVAILGEEGEVLPPGETGEICIRPTVPHSIMERYYGFPEATLEAWEGLWLHTGDIGWKDDDGMLYYVTRKAHFIRRRGENISATEVEDALNAHPAVADAAAVGVPNRDVGGEDVKAYVRTTEDVDPGELVDWCRDRIADFKVPRYIEFVDGFPRSETKETIQRHTLRDRGIGDAWDRTA